MRGAKTPYNDNYKAKTNYWILYLFPIESTQYKPMIPSVSLAYSI
jgi:hypothetical protein